MAEPLSQLMALKRDKRSALSGKGGLLEVDPAGQLRPLIHVLGHTKVNTAVGHLKRV